MVTDIGKRSLLFTWMEHVCDDQNGNITKYSYVLTDKYRNIRTTGDTTDTRVAFDDLTPYVLYSFRVAVWTGVGQGPYSADVAQQTLEDSKSTTFHGQSIT